MQQWRKKIIKKNNYTYFKKLFQVMHTGNVLIACTQMWTQHQNMYVWNRTTVETWFLFLLFIIRNKIIVLCLDTLHSTEKVQIHVKRLSWKLQNTPHLKVKGFGVYFPFPFVVKVGRRSRKWIVCFKLFGHVIILSIQQVHKCFINSLHWLPSLQHIIRFILQICDIVSSSK